MIGGSEKLAMSPERRRKMNKTIWDQKNKINENNQTSYIGIGLALGFLIGAALGIVLGLVFADSGLGMIFGAWAGLAIGLASGAILDDRIME
ncbi:MAG: hypothetical protein PVH03_07710 [Chloroflexota bacterium]|jgi:F0F1-type ATP synthase assembly protein I